MAINASEGSFTTNGATYVGYITENGKRTKLSEGKLTAHAVEELLKSSCKAFKASGAKTDEVSRAVFSIGRDGLSLKCFNDDQPIKATLKQDEVTDRVQSAMRAYLPRNGTASFVEVGFVRETGAQTCYANTFLQLQLEQLGKKKLGEFRKEGNEASNVYVARKAAWDALREIQQEVVKARSEKRPVKQAFVKKFLDAATQLSAASGHPFTWNDVSNPQDLMELWKLIRDQLGDELGAEKLQGAFNDDVYGTHACALTPDSSHLDLQKLLDAKLGEQSQTPPKVLPLAINRMSDSGAKTRVELAIPEELTISGKTYQLAAAVEHFGVSGWQEAGKEGAKVFVNQGHYVAWRRDGKNYIQYDDHREIKAFDSKNARKALSKTSTLLIYRQT